MDEKGNELPLERRITIKPEQPQNFNDLWNSLRTLLSSNSAESDLSVLLELKNKMDIHEIVLEIADGTISVSRIKRIIKAIYDVDVEPDLIAGITTNAGIATPQRQPSSNPLENQYPDRWSILLEARSFWVRVRRYWGDGAANTLKKAIESASAERWRGLQIQFEAYISPAIQERQQINLNCAHVLLPLPLESLYPWDLQRDLYVQGFHKEFELNPEPQSGTEFPLPTPEWETSRREEFEAKCIEKFETEIGSEAELIDFFGRFWSEVYQKRGDRYFQNLKRDLVGTVDQPLSQRSFYSATEGNFRHWLRNLDGFKTNAPWRIVLTRGSSAPLPMILEGALKKYGWRKVQSLAALGVLRMHVDVNHEQ